MPTTPTSPTHWLCHMSCKLDLISHISIYVVSPVVSNPCSCIWTAPPCMHRISTSRQGKPLQLTLSIFLLTQFHFYATKWSLSLFDQAFHFKHKMFHIFVSCVKSHILPFLKEACFTFWAIFYILAVSSVRWILKQKGNY